MASRAFPLPLSGRRRRHRPRGLGARERCCRSAIALAMTALAWAIAPDRPRDLGSQPFFSLSIFAVHAYFIVYGFALIFCAVAQYFVSAKRFVDRGKSPAWAGLAPFACCSPARRIGFSRVRKARCRVGRSSRSTRWRSPSWSGTSPTGIRQGRSVGAAETIVQLRAAAPRNDGDTV